MPQRAQEVVEHMKVKMKDLDPRLLKKTKTLASWADKKGMPLYLVGGMVRDLILKKRNLDLDLIVVGDAISLARQMAPKLKARILTHSRFNTATLICDDGLKVDLAMARAEEYSSCGALPTVRPASIHDDLFRRDFTINAMAIDLNKKSFGHLIDVYNGMQDLRAGKIRVLHEGSFWDDPTRIIRAVRFEQRFNFFLERKTRRALKHAIEQGAMKCITPQRFFNEFYNLLKEPMPVKDIRRMSHLKAWDPFLRGFKPDLRLLAVIQKGLAHLKGRQGYEDMDEPLIYLMGLAATMPARCFRKVTASFGLTKEQRDCLQALKRMRWIVIKLNQRKVSPSQAHGILGSLPLTAIVFMRVCFSSKLLLRRIDFYMRESRFMELAINGNVLQKMGLASDKSMGEVLSDLLRLKIDGHVSGSQQEMRMAETLVSDLKQERNRRQ